MLSPFSPCWKTTPHGERNKESTNEFRYINVMTVCILYNVFKMFYCSFIYSQKKKVFNCHWSDTALKCRPAKMQILGANTYFYVAVRYYHVLFGINKVQRCTFYFYLVVLPQCLLCTFFSESVVNNHVCIVFKKRRDTWKCL